MINIGLYQESRSVNGHDRGIMTFEFLKL